MEIWKAYGLYKASNRENSSYVLPHSSFLYSSAIALAVLRTPHHDSESDVGYLSPTSVIRLLRKEIGGRVLRRIGAMAAICRRLDTLRLCLPYTFTGHCDEPKDVRAATCTADHIPVCSDTHPLNQHGFHFRLHIHTQIIMIYGTLTTTEDDDSDYVSGVWDVRYVFISSSSSSRWRCLMHYYIAFSGWARSLRQSIQPSSSLAICSC